MPPMKRLSARGEPDWDLADFAGELSARPKYAPIPEFGVVVLESRHSREWSAPGWFDEDFNKISFKDENTSDLYDKIEEQIK